MAYFQKKLKSKKFIAKIKPHRKLWPLIYFFFKMFAKFFAISIFFRNILESNSLYGNPMKINTHRVPHTIPPPSKPIPLHPPRLRFFSKTCLKKNTAHLVGTIRPFYESFFYIFWLFQCKAGVFLTILEYSDIFQTKFFNIF